MTFEIVGGGKCGHKDLGIYQKQPQFGLIFLDREDSSALRELEETRVSEF